jgi:uncharacterized DUF497 family protein
MKINSFIWDEGNIDHIARHNVAPDEAEEVFEARRYLLRARDGRYAVFGRTVAGRYLVCVLETTGRPGILRIVTARNMEPPERRLFKKKVG